MSFRKLSDAAEDLKDFLQSVTAQDGSKLFLDIRTATITSHDQLLRLMPTITRLPAAVVCIGSGEFDPSLTIRTMRPGIVIIDQLQIDHNRAASVWDILDSTVNAFIVNDEPRKINDVYYAPGNFVPVAASSNKSAYMLELNATN